MAIAPSPKRANQRIVPTMPEPKTMSKNPPEDFLDSSGLTALPSAPTRSPPPCCWAAGAASCAIATLAVTGATTRPSIMIAAITVFCIFFMFMCLFLFEAF